MKPVRIFTHIACEPPGYLAELLDRLGYRYEQVCLYDGIPVPMETDSVAALVFMGGPGNVNQATDWMQQEIELIRRAHENAIPMLGICLGGQLMSKALGGKVWPAETIEVGWHEVELLPDARTHTCFANIEERFPVFQWHAHVFSPPPGAQALVKSHCTDCQGFSIGKSLAMQFHLEMTETIIRGLIQQYGSDLSKPSSCVQTSAQILDQIDSKSRQVNAIADTLFTHWFRSLYE